jgi:hypothetical protein
MTFDDAHLYWVQNMHNYGTDPILFKVPKGGGETIGLVPGLEIEFSSEQPHGVAQHAGSLFWTDWRSGAVYRVGRNGGERERIASGQQQPHAILVHGDLLYWTTLGTFNRDKGTFERDGTLATAPIVGGAVEVLASGLDHPSAVAVDDVFAFIACRDRILKVPRQGGNVVTVVEGQLNIRGIQQHGNFVYWTDERGAVFRKAK